MTKPLVSYILFCYNQEQYVREAANAALAQTYSPLEVILSDDGSSDRTFEILREVAEKYQGPHTVRLNRVECNRGLMHHIVQATSQASGEWYVLGAGDDLSHKDRTAILMAGIPNDTRRIRAIFSEYQTFEVSEHAAPILNAKLAGANGINVSNLVEGRRVVENLGYVFCGATWAYHRTCFDRFEPLWEELNAEDRVLPFRAFLLGEILHVRQPLVARRISSNSLGQRNNSLEAVAPVEAARMEDLTLEAMLHDVETAVANGLVTSNKGSLLKAEMRAIHETHQHRRSRYRNIPNAQMTEHLRALAAICRRGDFVGIYQYLRMWAGSKLHPQNKESYR